VQEQELGSIFMFMIFVTCLKSHMAYNLILQKRCCQTSSYQ